MEIILLVETSTFRHWQFSTHSIRERERDFYSSLKKMYGRFKHTYGRINQKFRKLHSILICSKNWEPLPAVF